MHIKVFDVRLIWFFVVMSTKSGETFVAKICLYGVYTPDQNVQSTIELFLVQDQGIVDIPLNEELVMKRRFWQISEFL